MKNFILILAFLISAQFAMCEILTDKLPEVNYRNPDGTEFVPNSASYPKISQIEKLTFAKTFEDEPVEIRLNRLESTLYKKDYSDLTLAQRVEKIENTLDEKSINSKDRNSLTKLEKRIFNKSYTQDSVQTRIERLEKSILGANQSGDMASRIETLNIASSSLENQSEQLARSGGYRYPAMQMPYQNNFFGAGSNFMNTYQPQNGFKNAVRNMFSVLSPGVLTGFSPSVNSNYSQQYGNYSPYSATQNAYYNQSGYGRQNPNENFYYPQPNNVQKNYFQDIYKDNSGDEMYYRDGRFYKDLKSTSGGCGVTIIN